MLIKRETLAMRKQQISQRTDRQGISSHAAYYMTAPNRHRIHAYPAAIRGSARHQDINIPVYLSILCRFAYSVFKRNYILFIHYDVRIPAYTQNCYCWSRGWHGIMVPREKW